MGLASRNKGKRGERLLVKELQAMGFADSKRGQQVSGLESADIVGVVPGLRFESKHGVAVAPKLIYTNLEKLIRECAPDELPFLCLHRTDSGPNGSNGGKTTPWLAVVPLRFFTAIARRWLRSLGYQVILIKESNKESNKESIKSEEREV